MKSSDTEARALTKKEDVAAATRAAAERAAEQRRKIPREPPGASGKGLARLWRTMGPGITTGAADDDPSGIATYSIAGAQFGTALLWTALLTWPLMASVQSMCARIGMVTGQGLMGTLK